MYEQVHLQLGDNHRFDSDQLRWNITMQCASCIAGRPIGPRAGKNTDRALYYLVTYGILRIKYFSQYVPSWLNYVEIHETTGGHKDTARQIAGQAVAKIKGLWVASHNQDGGYMLSHLKTTPEPCNGALCSVDRAEIYVRSAAREAEKRDENPFVPVHEGELFENPLRVPQVR